jgi:hypothetical protein
MYLSEDTHFFILSEKSSERFGSESPDRQFRNDEPLAFAARARRSFLRAARTFAAVGRGAGAL